MKKVMSIVCGIMMMVGLMACGAKQVQVIDCSEAEIIEISEVVMFDWDSYEIRADQMELLNSIAATMIANPDLVLVLEGHASVEGETDYNLNLSQMRADSVKSMLMLSQVPEQNIQSSIGQGETDIFGEILDTNRRVMVLSVD